MASDDRRAAISTIKMMGLQLAGRRGPSPLGRGSTALPSMNTLLLPVSLIICAGLLIVAALVAYFTQSEDRQAIEASRKITQASLDVESREIAYDLDSYAWWDEAVNQVTTKLEPQWLDDNFGSYQTDKHEVTASFVLDPHDKTIVSFVEGKRSNLDALTSIQGGLAALVQRTRASSLIEPVAATGPLFFRGEPMLVGADAITPELGSPAWPAGTPRYVLVFAKSIDQGLLDRVARRSGVVDLHLSEPGDEVTGASLSLTSPDGSQVGSLSWTPERPALGMIIAAGPAVGTVLLIMIALFLLFQQRVRHIGNLLRQQAIMIDQIHDAIIATEPPGTITRWNAGAEKMLGYSEEEIVGKSISALFPQADEPSFTEKLKSLGAAGEHFGIELSLRRKDGKVLPTHMSLTPVRDKSGRITSTIGYALDITRQKELEAKLEELATVDELTGAFNRRHLQIHGPLELQRARRFHHPLAILLLDLDHFKRINDEFGHQFGDLVLATLSELCRKQLRPSDMFVRYGGEEFVILMPETALAEAIGAAKRLVDQVRGTVFSLNPRIGLTVSIGVSELRSSDQNLSSVINRADSAMYSAKEHGRDRVEVCTEPASTELVGKGS